MEIYLLTTVEADDLRYALDIALRNGREVRLAVDGGVKFKVGGGMWSLPLGERERDV